ncbi:MAG: DegQ family serine endoprotease [Burkholderiales bacterium]|nr:DegQ family serine endoprotease [Burkholderiales bacterium]
MKLKLKPVVVALVAAGVVGTGVGLYRQGDVAFLTSAQAGTAPVAAIVAQPATPSAQAAVALPNFRSIVQTYGPAIVNISVTQREKAGQEAPDMPGLDQNSPFYWFFRQFPQMPQGPRVVRGQGSGFILSPDGYILTNAHVVDGATEVQVKLTDKREFKAKVVGADRMSDVALIKIDAKDLPTVKLGDPSSVQVGDWVLAIGSPFGFENSATAGIVSAKGRSLPSEGYVPFIQTDVAINPGNSGGPLFNLAGEVIGINSQIYSRTGGYMGVSFAIPINVAMSVEQQLLAHGKVTRGRLGVTIQQVNQSLAESFGLPKPEGALVSSVEPGSPAEKAGLKTGDVILKFDGKPIADSGELPTRVAATKPGTKSTLEVWRKGERKEVDVTVGELKSAETVATAGAQHEQLGLTVHPLTPDEKSEAGVKRGLVVDQVNGPAEAAGIQPGDVILALNGTPVSSVGELRSLVEHASKHVALLVQRGDARIFVPINLG